MSTIAGLFEGDSDFLLSSSILESLVLEMESIARKSSDYYDRTSIKPEELLKVGATSASIAQCVEWIPYITNLYRRELLEKKNILERVSFGELEGIAFLFSQWTSPIHVDRGVST